MISYPSFYQILLVEGPKFGRHFLNRLIFNCLLISLNQQLIWNRSTFSYPSDQTSTVLCVSKILVMSSGKGAVVYTCRLSRWVTVNKDKPANNKWRRIEENKNDSSITVHFTAFTLESCKVKKSNLSHSLTDCTSHTLHGGFISLLSMLSEV